MASIVIKIGDQVSYHDLNRIRTGIVKNLLQQNVPVFASWTEDPRQLDVNVGQNDMTNPDISGAAATTPNVSGAT